MRVLAAMSGGVDSSVAAAMLRDDGHDVVGATMKLWAGPSDGGCCSVADVDDARRVAQQLGLDHHVFNFSADFDRHVVDPYVADHAAGRTPNPCIECNRHLKFDRFLVRALQLGFDAIATGHHARVVRGSDGMRLLRGVDSAKDQSYVLHVLDQVTLARTLLPVGERTKSEVRAMAAACGLRTADKPDSQDVCFISVTPGGRRRFLADRMDLHPARVVSSVSGEQVGSVDAVELMTVGQRRGLGGQGGDGRPRYVLDLDTSRRVVTVGEEADLLVDRVRVSAWTWTSPTEPAVGQPMVIQTSAHGRPVTGHLDVSGAFVPDVPIRRIAPGQSVVVYDGDVVMGGGPAL